MLLPIAFSTRNASLRAFSPCTQWVYIVFMFLAGVNFVLHFNVPRGFGRLAVRDEEFDFYALAVLSDAAVLFTQVLQQYETVEAAVRAALFRVVSIVTITGSVTADYELGRRWRSSCCSC